MRPARPDDFRLPDLRFVPVDSLVPHERHDSQRLEPLVERLREQAVLRNPPVVTPLNDGPDGRARFMVLDGANRSTAARAAGFPHVVVQVARYEDPWVQLSTWHHALSEVPHQMLIEECGQVKGLRVLEEPLLHAQAEIARRDVLAYACLDDGCVLTFRGGTTLEEHNEMLNGIVDVYRERHRFYRMSTDSIDVARERHPDATALIVFPHLTPAEVMELAENGSKLPAGITRHLIRWRALRINVPTEKMSDTKMSIDAKNAWLAELLSAKWESREVRFYEEPTVLFDE
jgi:L-serine kinase (ATP) / ParB family transcriptional regulator, heme-responsive regulator